MTCSIKDTLLNTSLILRFPKFLLFFFLVIFKYTHTDNLRAVLSKKIRKNIFFDTFINSAFHCLVQRQVGCVFSHLCNILCILVGFFAAAVRSAEKNPRPGLNKRGKIL